jgi:hypothetical protein
MEKRRCKGNENRKLSDNLSGGNEFILRWISRDIIHQTNLCVNYIELTGWCLPTGLYALTALCENLWKAAPAESHCGFFNM